MLSRTSLIGTGTAVLIATSLGFVPAASSASAAPTPAAATASARPAAASTLPVDGSFADGTTFAGELSDLTVRTVDGALRLTGTVSGTGLPAAGTPFSAPIDSLAVPTGCSILDLDLGPLDLDLLGLVINLSPVSLDITAVPGPGNLLGNLLCAVAGLLDRDGPLTGLTALLNRLLSALGL